jgi:hypothetical protein
MWSRTVVIRFLVASSLAWNFTGALANPAKPKILSVLPKGSGCLPKDVTWGLTPEGNFNATFLNFQAIFEGESHKSECALEVKVLPPPGYQLAITGARLEGAYFNSPGGVLEAKHSYTIHHGPLDPKDPSTVGVSSLNGTWNNHPGESSPEIQNWNLEFTPGFEDVSDIPENWKGACGGETMVEGTSTLLAQSDNSGSDLSQAEIYLDRTTDGTKGRLLWNWTLIPCKEVPGPVDSGLWNGNWNFSYQAPNGRLVSGKMQLGETQGSYRPRGAGWSGELNHLKFSQKRLKGTWKGNGSEGLFDFQLAFDGKSFDGSYWHVDQNGKTTQGHWKGHR